MSNIDKQAVTAKTKELAFLMVERFSMNPVSCKLLNEAWEKEYPDEVAIAARMLALLDENIQLRREKDAIEAIALARRDDMQQAREQLAAAERLIAELDKRLIKYAGIATREARRVAELGSFHTAYLEWSDKTEWVQNDKRFDVVRPLGKHRADVLREYIEHLEARQIALPQRLSPEGYHIDEAYMVDDAEGEYLDRDAVIEAISAAGIKVIEGEGQ